MAVTLPEITVEDIAGRADFALDEWEAVYIENLIQEGIDRIASRWGQVVASRLQSGALTTHMYKGVVARAVLRVLRNPEGFTQEQEGNYSYGKRAMVASGYLWFSEDDITDLLGVNRRAMPGTVRVGIHGAV